MDQDKQIELSPLDPHYRKIPITDGPYDVYLKNYIIPSAKRRWENETN